VDRNAPTDFDITVMVFRLVRICTITGGNHKHSIDMYIGERDKLSMHPSRLRGNEVRIFLATHMPLGGTCSKHLTPNQDDFLPNEVGSFHQGLS